jgi:outer membrane biosynthesis protein TonB
MADGEAKKGKDRPYWLPFVLAIGMLLWLIYLFLNSDVVDKTQFSFSEWVTISYLVTVVMLIWLLIWKITLNTEVATEVATEAAVAAATAEEPKKKTRPKPTPPEPATEEEIAEAEKATAKPRKKRVVVASGTSATKKIPHDDELPEGLKRPEDVISEDVEDMADMPRVVEYPKKEPGGVYSDTLLKVDENLILNYRILLGKVCHNCEELDECKRRVEGKLDDDIFLENFECKDGIKAELQKARKKRETEEEKAESAKDMVEEKAAKAKEEEKEASDDEGAEKKKPSAKKKTTKKKKAPSSGTKKKTSAKGKPKAGK